MKPNSKTRSFSRRVSGAPEEQGTGRWRDSCRGSSSAGSESGLRSEPTARRCKGHRSIGAAARGVAQSGAAARGVAPWAQLQGASLYSAELQGASLDWAQLQGAWLVEARLKGASLNGAWLQGASLDWAELQGASLEVARVRRARGQINLDLTIFDYVDCTRMPWEQPGRDGTFQSWLDEIVTAISRESTEERSPPESVDSRSAQRRAHNPDLGQRTVSSAARPRLEAADRLPRSARLFG